MPSPWDVILAFAPWLGGVLLTIVGLLAIAVGKERKLVRLLGVDKTSRRVIIYISSLFVPRGAAHDFRAMARSYEGITVPIEEFSASAALSGTLRVDPLENIPPVIRKRLEERSPRFKRISYDVNASPLREADIDFTTRSIITIGSHGYNIVTDYTRVRGLSQLQVTDDGTAIEIVQGIHKGEVIKPVDNKHDIAQLEKLRDPSRDGTTFVVAAGLGVIGTMGAVNYLMENWKEMDQAYGSSPFALVIQFGPMGTAPLSEILKGVVIRRLPEA